MQEKKKISNFKGKIFPTKNLGKFVTHEPAYRYNQQENELRNSQINF